MALQILHVWNFSDIPVPEIDYPSVEVCFSENAGREDNKLITGTFQCSCQINNGDPCSTRYSTDELLNLRMHHLEMTHNELDLIILAKISVGIRKGQTTVTSHRKEQNVRLKNKNVYYHEGLKICRETFMFMHGIFKDRLNALFKHYNEFGVQPRIHGNVVKQPKHALKPEDCQAVVTFINNYAEINAVLLPGRIPGYKQDKLKLLPSSCSKASVFRLYVEAIKQAGKRQVASRTFYRLWKLYSPYILPMKPRSDLCWTCQQNSTRIIRSCNLSDEDKSTVLRNAQLHLAQASTERLVYSSAVTYCKSDVSAADLKCLNVPNNGKLNCSLNITMHYSFDFAQQVHYPYDPLQPGPIYFKTPRKCGVFGVMTEGLPQMVMFLIDECVSVSRGANSVISMLDYFFDNYGVKENKLHLHADNCSGQNKNNAMIHYLLWRVMTGKHLEITLSFMLPGHTKFAPDWCFAIFKRHYRKSRVDCLEDISAVVKSSCPSGILIPQLCGKEDGTVMVPTYAWDTHFYPTVYRKLPSIKKYHHFTFKSDGSVICRQLADSEPEVYKILQPNAQVPSAQPSTLKPGGLNHDRQMYLYNEIREFVAEEKRDLVCPKPNPDQALHTNNSILNTVFPTADKVTLVADENEMDAEADENCEPSVKRGRGRPRKATRDGPGRPRKL